MTATASDPATGPEAAEVGALPSDLTVRFVVLTLLIIAASAGIYGHLWLLLMTRNGSAVTCLSSQDVAHLDGIAPAVSRAFLGWTDNALACGPMYAPGLVRAGVAGGLVVMIAAYVGYRLTPWWYLRYGKRFWAVILRGATRVPLASLAEKDSGAAQEIAGMAALMCLDPLPTLVYSPNRRRAYVFGTARRSWLCVGKPLLRTRAKDPVTFTGVARHELGHVRNRDNRQTYFGSAAWKSFCVLAVLPYVVVMIVTAPTLDGENLHIAAAVGTLVGIVYLSRAAMLRTRELQADATAGRYDADEALRSILRRAKPDRAVHRWRARFGLHPTDAQRLRAAEDVTSLDRAPLGQVFAAGVAVSVLSADTTAAVWYWAVASGMDRPLELHSSATFVIGLIVVIVANLPSVCAVAWLASVYAWRSQMFGRLKPRPARTALFSVSLVAGLMVGEPMSVTYADANLYGAFEGLRYGDGSGAVCAALFMIAAVAAIYRWAWENAEVWLSAGRRALRTTAVVSGVALAMVYAVWWAMKDSPMIASWYAWDPVLAGVLDESYWSPPVGAWVLGLYVPTGLLGSLPGQALLLLLPVFVFLSGLRRHTAPDERPRLLGVLAGVLAGSAAVLVTTAVTLHVRALAGPHDIGINKDTAALYFVQVDVWLVAAAAIIAAAIVAFRAPAYAGTMGVFTAVLAVAVAAVFEPIVVLTGLCGARALTCSTGGTIHAYAELYELISNRSFVLATLAAIVVAGIALTTRRARSGPARPALRPHRTVVAAGVFVAVSVVAATCLDLVL